jgi:VanZ family protein
MDRARGWRGWAAAALLATALQLYGLYRASGPAAPPWFPHLDKVGHAAGFALPLVLAVLALGLHAGPRTYRRRQLLALLVAASAAHAVVSELVQHTFYRHRTGDPADVLADWVGVAVGAGAGHLLLRRRWDRTAVR